jgi:hypothetical protein
MPTATGAKSSSGRTEPNNLNEKLAMDEAKTGMGQSYDAL